MKKKLKDGIEFAVRSTLNVIIQNHDRTRFVATGSGAMVQFGNRFFFCTVEHNVDENKNKVAILTGRWDGAVAMTVQPDELSFLKQITMEEISADELEKVLANVENIAPLDVAFAEVQELELLQEERTIMTHNGLTFTIEAGNKNVIDIEKIDCIKKDARYSFAGRINSCITAEGCYSYENKLVTGMKLVDMDEHLIRFDLGSPIVNHKEFEGCSGAPIVDEKGNLVALLKGGDEDPNGSYVYGFRLDRLKAFIKLTYFNPSLDAAILLPPPNKT